MTPPSRHPQERSSVGVCLQMLAASFHGDGGTWASGGKPSVTSPQGPTWPAAALSPSGAHSEVQETEQSTSGRPEVQRVLPLVQMQSQWPRQSRKDAPNVVTEERLPRAQPRRASSTSRPRRPGRCGGRAVRCVEGGMGYLRLEERHRRTYASIVQRVYHRPSRRLNTVR